MNKHYYIDKAVWRDYQQYIKSVCITLVLTSLLLGCSLNNPYSLHSGINYVAGRGNPPADKLIWSRTSLNKILVTASEYGFGKSQVYTLDILTGETRMIAETDYGIIVGESWSPNETRLILDIDPSTSRYENNDGLWIWDAKERQPIEFLGKSGLAIWSPTGKTIAIFDSSDGSEILYLLDVETQSKTSVTIGNTALIGDIVGADWSPDELNIALALGNPRSSIDQHLYIYDIESGQLTRLTKEGDVYHPVWSPLGDRIAYVKHARGTGSDSLHLINVNGNCDMEIPNIDWIRSLTWSPDGKKLAFVGSNGIYTLDIDEFSRKNVSDSSCK